MATLTNTQRLQLEEQKVQHDIAEFANAPEGAYPIQPEELETLSEAAKTMLDVKNKMVFGEDEPASLDD